MDDLLDALGVPLALGQRVVYATAGMRATGQLVPGVIVKLNHVRDGDDDGPRERIGICRDVGGVVYIGWSKRVIVLRQESEAESWLRRQLAQLGTRS